MHAKERFPYEVSGIGAELVNNPTRLGKKLAAEVAQGGHELLSEN